MYWVCLCTKNAIIKSMPKFRYNQSINDHYERRQNEIIGNKEDRQNLIYRQLIHIIYIYIYFQSQSLLSSNQHALIIIFFSYSKSNTYLYFGLGLVKYSQMKF